MKLLLLQPVNRRDFVSLPTNPAANPPLLEVKGLTKFFGGLRAVHDLNITLNKGDLAGLIGPNGAGKQLPLI